MKKLLLLFAMLLGVVGAWAEVVIPEEGKYYVIKNFRSHKFAYYNGDDAQLLQQTNPTSATTQENLNKYMWYVTEAGGEGAYMLHNVATKKVYTAYNSFTEAGAVVYIKENPFKSGYVCVSSNPDAETDGTCWDDQGGQTKIGLHDPRENDNAGTSWEFIEIDRNATVAYTLLDNAGNSHNGTFTGWDREMLPAVTGVAGYTLSDIVYGDKNVTATVNFPFPVSKLDGTTNWTFIRSQAMNNGIKAYLYVNTSNNKIVTKSEHTNNGPLGYLPTVTEGEVQKWMWAIYPTLTEGKFTFQIKNAATGKFVPSEKQQNTSPLVNEEAGNYSWDTCIGSGKGFFLDGTSLFFGASSSDPNEKNAIIWSKTGSSHKGCNLEFIAPIYAANCKLTDNSGNNYSSLTTVNYTSNEGDVEIPNITGIPFSLISDPQWNDGVFSANVNFYFVASTPSKDIPTMISTYNYNGIKDSHKWYASDNKVKVEKENEKIAKGNIVTSSNIATHLWMIYPNFENGAFTFKIKNLATGLYINSSANSSQHNSASTVALSENASNFTLGHRDGDAIEFINSANYRLSVNSSGDKQGEQTVGTHTSHYGSAITFPIVSYIVNVSEVGYATLYTPIAGTFTGNVKTYAIKETNATHASLEELVGIAANQGAIIEAAEGTYTFTAGDVSSDWNGNLLTGTSVNTMVEGDAYVLGNVDGVGLYKAKLTDGSFLNNAGKAYLPAVPAGARFLSFDFGTETAIESVEAETATDAVVYDLAGRRVQNAQKGLYIVNGKVVIK